MYLDSNFRLTNTSSFLDNIKLSWISSLLPWVLSRSCTGGFEYDNYYNRFILIQPVWKRHIYYNQWNYLLRDSSRRDEWIARAIRELSFRQFKSTRNKQELFTLAGISVTESKSMYHIDQDLHKRKIESPSYAEFREPVPWEWNPNF